MSSSITLFALAAAGGLVLGWFLCHLAHASARADAAFYREEAEVLRSKAIRIDEQRLSAHAEAQALHEQLDELRATMVVDVGADSASGSASDIASGSASDTASGIGPSIDLGTVEADPPVHPGQGRLAEAFGSD